MKHKIIPIMAVVVWRLCFFALTAQAKYGGGSGEPNNPYLIYTSDQMNKIGLNEDDWESHFILMADIDMSGFTGTNFNIIGINYLHPFTGVFDGNGHTISNFTYDSNDRDYIGLFGYVYGGDIKNLGLIDPNVDAGTREYVGALVGWLLYGGNITDCYVEGGSVKGYYNVGGLVGGNGGCGGNSGCYGGTISNCYSTSSVLGYSGIGGLVGINAGTITNCCSSRDASGHLWVGGLTGLNHGTISCCYSNGGVEGGNQVGGLVGGNGGTITNSYANGGVLASEEVGGLVGRNGWYVPMLANDFGTISKCYSTGRIEGSPVGGLVGYNQYGEVLASFWDTETSGLNWSDGGTGLPTVEMQNPNTYIEVGWDFIGQPDGPHDIWAEPESGGYPILWWQLSPLASLPAFSGGSGTADDPYLISTPNDLNHIGHNPRLMDAHFKLISDIDLIGYEVYIIGSQLFPFTGEFYGNGHKISNFTYSSTATGYVGLFGYVDGPDAVIKDLGLIDPNVDAGTADYVGSLVGRLNCGTITNCYVESGSVTGDDLVGGLVGVVEENYYGAITNCYSSAAVSGDAYVGGLVGRNYDGAISNCYSTGSVTGIGGVSGLVGGNDGGIITDCYSSVNITGDDFVGGLVGFNRGTITNCYSLCSISGAAYVGGVVGENNIGNVSYCYFKGIVSGTGSYSGGIAGINGSRAKISNCYSSGSVQGNGQVGGLAGGNSRGIISDGIVTNCYSTSSVEGNRTVGGLIGLNKSVVENSYSTGSVSGVESVGGLVGKNSYNTYGYGDISKCYSSGSVSGTTEVGGLVGLNESGTVSNSFWDIQASGQSNSDGGTGKTTAQMQESGTFIDAGWDFVNVWWIIEGVDYPRHLWEVPVLHAEPELTLGTSNTISWNPVVGDVEYYAECAVDANFTSIIHNSGWITETSYEFTGLQLSKRYWYSVKARNAAGLESQWSNVESSLQCSLSDAVKIELAPESLKNENLKNALLNKINEVLEMIDEGLYKNALNKLENDILQKTNGCAETGSPDKNDWIITCEGQSKVYPLIIETIEHVKVLME